MPPWLPIWTPTLALFTYAFHRWSQCLCVCVCLSCLHESLAICGVVPNWRNHAPHMHTQDVLFMRRPFFLRDIRKRKCILGILRDTAVFTPLAGIAVERNDCWDSVSFQKDELLVRQNWQSESVSRWSAADWITLLLSLGWTPAFKLQPTIGEHTDFVGLVHPQAVKTLTSLPCFNTLTCTHCVDVEQIVFTVVTWL